MATFADDIVILTSHKNPTKASKFLRDLLKIQKMVENLAN